MVTCDGNGSNPAKTVDYLSYGRFVANFLRHVRKRGTLGPTDTTRNDY